MNTKTRHGKTARYYWPRGERKIRLFAEPGTPDFLREYLAAKNGGAPAEATPGMLVTPTTGAIKAG